MNRLFLKKLTVLAVILTLLSVALAEAASSRHRLFRRQESPEAAVSAPSRSIPVGPGAEARPTPAPSQTSLPTSTPLPPSPTATVTPLAGTVTAQINVRSGPNVSYSSLGLLNSGDKIQIIGKDPSGGWYGILYPSAAQGHGWVTAAYVQTNDTASLPVLNAAGISEAILWTPVTPGASLPTSIPVTPTPTLGPASADDDSSAGPAIQVTFSPAGTGQFSYTSDVSSPQGDAEDWVEFTPYSILEGSPARLLFSLVCDGNGNLEVELWQGGAPLAGWGRLACGGQHIPLDLAAGTPYQLHLRATTGDRLQYVHYTLTVRNAP